MSGLELAASLAGLVSLGLECCKGITEYCSSYQGAQKDVELLHEDTSTLMRTLLVGNHRRFVIICAQIPTKQHFCAVANLPFGERVLKAPCKIVPWGRSLKNRSLTSFPHVESEWPISARSLGSLSNQAKGNLNERLCLWEYAYYILFKRKVSKNCATISPESMKFFNRPPALFW